MMYKEGNGILRLEAYVTCFNCNCTSHTLIAAGITNRKGFEKELRKAGWRQNAQRRWLCSDECKTKASQRKLKEPKTHPHEGLDDDAGKQP